MHNNIAIYVKTQEECNQLLEYWEKQGKVWSNGEEQPTEYNIWKQTHSTKLYLYLEYNKIYSIDITNAERNNYKILTYTQYMDNVKPKKEFKVGDKIRIIKCPEFWANLLGRSPLNLTYPRVFKIEKTVNDFDYITMRTEEGYGFDLSHLIGENNIELIPEFKIELNLSKPNEKTTNQPTAENIRQKVKTMKAYLLRNLSASKKAQYKAGIREADLSLTDEGKDALLNVLANKEENDKELADIAREINEENK